ncbi:MULTISPECIES: hypothetical protein [Paracoccus]|uniref:hypothetical protein n=1 Tax=Paracoccus TaxID=265 RepID=UPI000FDB6FEF|nr:MULTISPECIES: hypothetical protein [Paracoccus]AZY95354.1 hypothetical protein EOJ32_16255 [Paracoccus sp. Arc7-R13]TNC03924.1 hypothetical protein FHD68_07245 [Paracoccus marcusii]TYP67929.1 hypothetical protein A9A71_106137 [Stutzerimonas stutzeri]
MKNFVYALAALSLTAGGAMAAANGSNERPDGSLSSAQVEAKAQTKQVPARSVMTGEELSRAGLSGDELLSVTSVGSDDKVANLYRDR